MSDSNTAPDPENAAIEAMAQISDALMRIERERSRVRAEDWATLFRQTQDVLYELLTHPFVEGDMEAELRLQRIIYADDLEEMDKSVDFFAEYVVGKLEYHAAVKAHQEGKEHKDVPRFTTPSNSTSEVTRAQAMHGPSGSDFMIQNEDKTDSAPAQRRSVLRL